MEKPSVARMIGAPPALCRLRPVFGARPLKRFLQRNLEARLARPLIAGKVAEDSKVPFKVKGDVLVMT